LEEELPRDTIRYSSKIVSIEEDGNVKILQLADGSVLRAKVENNHVLYELFIPSYLQPHASMCRY
jgi:hypothetical protein